MSIDPDRERFRTAARWSA